MRILLALALFPLGVFALNCGGDASTDGEQQQQQSGPAADTFELDDRVSGPNNWSYENLAALTQTLRRLPPGEYFIGSNRSDTFPDRAPRHRVDVGEIELSNVPVSNENFLTFVGELDGYSKEILWSDEGWRWKNEYDIAEPSGWSDIKDNIIPGSTDDSLDNNKPIVGVSFYEAEAFARSLGCLEDASSPACQYRSKKYDDGAPVRLPTEAEFEVASSLQGANGQSARGDCNTQNERYPWGDAHNPSNVVNSGRLASNGVAGAGMARCVGLLDVKGNILQWTTSEYQPYPGSSFVVPEEYVGWKVARGSDYRANDAIREISSRTQLRPMTRSERVGFRLAIEDPSYVDCIWSDLRLECPFRG